MLQLFPRNLIEAYSEKTHNLKYGAVTVANK